MNHQILDRLKEKNITTSLDFKNNIREIIQEITLYALSTTDFFDRCAFCGGTALRIFYGLSRASEDLDFVLKNRNDNFKIDKYLDAIKDIFNDFKIDISTLVKNDRNIVKSAFIKSNTYMLFLDFNLDNEKSLNFDKKESIKIKLEIDTNPPEGALYENKYMSFPYAGRISLLNPSSLFSGKLHAIICRDYDNNVKGRDYYDFIFYINHNIKPNYTLLKNALIQTNKINDNDVVDNKSLKQYLIRKYELIDFEKAKEDVSRFIANKNEISQWSKEFFIDITNRYNF